MMLPLGARAKRAVYSEAPPGLRADEFAVAKGPDGLPIKDAKKERSDSGERGLWDMVLGELDKTLPAIFRPTIEVLRGRYSLDSKPSPPALGALTYSG